MTNHSLNFAESPRAPMWMRGAALGIVFMSAALSVVVFREFTGSAPTTASIGNAIDGGDAPIVTTSAPPTSSVIRPLSTEPMNSLALGLRSDSIRYYESETGRAFVTDLKSMRTETLSDRKLQDFIRSTWVPLAERVISEFDLAGAQRLRLYDYPTNTTTNLPASITSYAPSPDGMRLAYVQSNAGTTTLWVAGIDGSDPARRLVTRLENPHVEWPVSDIITLASNRSDRPGKSLSIVDDSDTLRVILTDKENLEYVWSRSGRRLLYSAFVEGEGIALRIIDFTSGTDTAVGMPTSARKCAWLPDEQSIVCGVPNDSSLSRDVPSDRTATSDDVIRLDLSSGDRELLHRSGSGKRYSVINPLVSSSGSFVVFTNLFDQRLYVIAR